MGVRLYIGSEERADHCFPIVFPSKMHLLLHPTPPSLPPSLFAYLGEDAGRVGVHVVRGDHALQAQHLGEERGRREGGREGG